MIKQPRTESCFDCRFETGTTRICLTRTDMPEQTFEARLEYVLPDTPESPRFACGFTVFIERGESHEHAIRRLMEKLRCVSPPSLDDADYSRLRDVATSWLLFNFRPAVDDATLGPKSDKFGVKALIHRALIAGIAAQEIVTDVLLDDSLLPNIIAMAA